nr:hypothetical protein [uncultured Lachnoclostridium sp.]
MADFFEVNEEVQDDSEIVEQCLLNVAELVRDEVLNLTDSRDTADVLTSLIIYRLPQVLDVLYDDVLGEQTDF